MVFATEKAAAGRVRLPDATAARTPGRCLAGGGRQRG